jgi:hypothetical protein
MSLRSTGTAGAWLGEKSIRPQPVQRLLNVGHFCPGRGEGGEREIRRRGSYLHNNIRVGTERKPN